MRRVALGYLIGAGFLLSLGSVLPENPVLFRWSTLQHQLFAKNSLFQCAMPSREKPASAKAIASPPPPVAVVPTEGAWAELLRADSPLLKAFNRLGPQSELMDYPASNAAACPGLSRFFDRLDGWGLSRGSNRTALCLFGDSVVGADFIPYPLRTKLQGLFGDGGPGFVEIAARGPPPPHVIVERRFDGWQASCCLDAQSNLVETRWGPCGTAFAWAGTGTAGRTALHLKWNRQFDSWRLHGQKLIGGGHVLISNELGWLELPTRATNGKPFTHYHREARPMGDVVLETIGDGPVRLYGMELLNTWGLALHTFSILGADYRTFPLFDEGVFSNSMAAMDPDLMILCFGQNSVKFDDFPSANYAWSMRQALLLLRRAAPQAPILVLGPMAKGIQRDGAWQVHPTVKTITKIQRTVALEFGAAFLSLHEALGGDESLPLWYEKDSPLMNADGIHPTAQGAERVAEAIFQNLLGAYRRDLLRRGLLHEERVSSRVP